MSNADLANRIISIKNDIEKKKEEKIKLETRLESTKDQLKAQGVNTPKEASTKLKELEDEITKLQNELEEGIEELEESCE